MSAESPEKGLRLIPLRLPRQQAAMDCGWWKIMRKLRKLLLHFVGSVKLTGPHKQQQASSS